MTRITRVLALYNRLKEGSCTVGQLSEQETDSTTSTRQIYRDLKDVAQFASTQGETLAQEPDGRYNRRIWAIRPDSEHVSLPADDLDTYYISRAVLPGVFTKQRAESLDRMQEVIRQRVMLSKAIKYKAGLSNQTITNSHFYENKVTTELDSKLKDILEAISQCLTLEISELSGDATSVSSLVKLPLDVLPVKIIFHRGCFYVATLRPADQRVLVFQIDQITYRTGKSFQRTKKLMNRVENDLANRFGITQNFDGEPHTIRLQFSGVTGKFVGEQNWHHSQKIDEVQGPDGKLNYVLTLKCGINRELVGWIFQWMSNVRVLEPPQLVELYEQQLAMMRDSIKDPAHVTLAYTNIFEPKPMDS